MLHLVANSTSPYIYNLLCHLLLISPILIPYCQLAQFPSPMGSPRRLSISLSIVTVWRNIAINNVMATSFFKCGPSLVSSNVKLVWSSTWKSFMVDLRSISSPSCCIKHVPNLDSIQTCWFLGYTTHKTFDKTNGVMYWLMRIIIHKTSKSWIRHIAIRHIDSPM